MDDILESSTIPLYQQKNKKKIYVSLRERPRNKDWAFLVLYALVTITSLLISVKLRLFDVSYSSFKVDIPILLVSPISH
jgi:hypothetical protein